MGKRDILDRKFFADRGRFAELVNAELYHGEKILIPEELELLKRSYPSLASVSGEKTRDIMMLDQRQNICYGLEIETESDYSMPERVMTYDASEYEYQIRELGRLHRERKEYKDYRSRKSRVTENDFLFPIVTMVLYLGEGQWQGKRKLRELFRIPKEAGQQLGRLLQDYDFLLIGAESVNVRNYHTDLREFFQAMQCRKEKKKLKELFQTEGFKNLSRETELVITAHLGEKKLFQQVEEGMSMCKALDDWMKEEREIGRREGQKQGQRQGQKQGQKQGRREGIRIGKLSSIKNLMETLHLSAEQAMDALKIPNEEKQKYYSKL